MSVPEISLASPRLVFDLAEALAGHGLVTLAGEPVTSCTDGEGFVVVHTPTLPADGATVRLAGTGYDGDHRATVPDTDGGSFNIPAAFAGATTGGRWSPA